MDDRDQGRIVVSGARKRTSATRWALVLALALLGVSAFVDSALLVAAYDLHGDPEPATTDTRRDPATTPRR